MPEQTAEAFLDYTFKLREELDIPGSLAEIGVIDTRAEEIGKLALEDPTAQTNAMPLEASDFQRLFRAAQAGDADKL